MIFEFYSTEHSHITLHYYLQNPTKHFPLFSSSSLNPYSYDESCVSSSVDHLPLAALPLLAIVSPRYQDAVATVIARANQVYHSFLQSEEGQGFSGQVCLTIFCLEERNVLLHSSVSSLMGCQHFNIGQIFSLGLNSTVYHRHHPRLTN